MTRQPDGRELLAGIVRREAFKLDLLSEASKQYPLDAEHLAMLETLSRCAKALGVEAPAEVVEVDGRTDEELLRDAAGPPPPRQG